MPAVVGNTYLFYPDVESYAGEIEKLEDMRAQDRLRQTGAGNAVGRQHCIRSGPPEFPLRFLFHDAGRDLQRGIKSSRRDDQKQIIRVARKTADNSLGALDADLTKAGITSGIAERRNQACADRLLYSGLVPFQDEERYPGAPQFI